MTIQQVTEHDLDNQGVRCVAVPSLELDGMKYVWLTSYANGMEAPAQKRCQDLCASGRAALMVRHKNGDYTIWQGPTGSAQPVAAEPQAQVEPMSGTPSTEEAALPAPDAQPPSRKKRSLPNRKRSR